MNLPAWLERIAEAKGLNFSLILQKALKERLGAKEGKL